MSDAQENRTDDLGAMSLDDEDQLQPEERCASTSNRNFEGRQGARGRTHLVSPAVAAATAVRGTLSSPADLDGPTPPGAPHTHGTSQEALV